MAAEVEKKAGFMSMKKTLYAERVLTNRGLYWPSHHSLACIRTGPLENTLQVGLAFLTNLVVHESGHVIVANHLGADNISMKFFTTDKGSFFFGLSNAELMDKEDRLPYSIGGEIFANLGFEYTLWNYRHNPTTYKKALLFFSGTDFLWYALYAFYLSDGNSALDPIAIQQETGIDRSVLIGVVLTQTLINGYRVYSGKDTVIPFLAFDEGMVTFNIRLEF